MRNKFLSTLVLVLSFGLPNSQAQETPRPKSIGGGGIVNGKAMSLPKPLLIRRRRKPSKPAARLMCR